MIVHLIRTLIRAWLAWAAQRTDQHVTKFANTTAGDDER